MFIESSWVENPAFAGAVKNFEIASPNFSGKQDITKLAFGFDDIYSLSKLKVADRRNMLAIRLAIAEVRRNAYAGMVDRIT